LTAVFSIGTATYFSSRHPLELSARGAMEEGAVHPASEADGMHVTLGGLFERDIEEEDQVETKEGAAGAAAAEGVDGADGGGDTGDVAMADDNEEDEGGDVDASFGEARRDNATAAEQDGEEEGEGEGEGDDVERTEEEEAEAEALGLSAEDLKLESDAMSGAQSGGEDEDEALSLDETKLATYLGDSSAAAKLAEYKSYKDEVYVVRGKAMVPGVRRRHRRIKEPSIGQILASYRKPVPVVEPMALALTYEARRFRPKHPNHFQTTCPKFLPENTLD